MNKDRNLIRTQIKKISFSLLSKPEIEKMSVLSLTSKDLYDYTTRTPACDGPLDRRLGVGNKQDVCLTCGEGILNCVGHFGIIDLVLPVYHGGLLKQIINTLYCVCKTCGKVLLPESKKLFFKEKLRETRNTSNLILVQRKINVECRKMACCVYCKAINGTVKKGSGFKILHEVALSNFTTEKWTAKSTAGFDLGFSAEKNVVRRGLKNVQKTIYEINPLIAFNIFSLVNKDDYEFLGLEESPVKLILRNIIVPPACIRPSVSMVEKNSTNEDDLTIKLSEIVHTNSLLKESIEKGNPIHIINEDWDNLQLQCALMINSEIPQAGIQTQPIKGIIQRLKGKHGRFRCNLSGKRVDFSGRTVISPNPNLAIDKVDVPEYMAKILTIPEKVTKFNLNKLQALVQNGPKVYPGANYVIGQNFKKFLMYGDKNEPLKEGDIVERHLQNGDIVLFNRQPSLHRMSIMAHTVNIHKNKTLRFNECVCAPYNADFDGDEMNIHVPQTLEAIAECTELMGVQENLVTPRHGEPLVAATQDFITAMYLVTSKDTFLNRHKMGQYFAEFAKTRISIMPAISQPIELFTGKQLFSAMIFDSLTEKTDTKKIILESKNRSFIDMWNENDGFVVFKNGILLHGRIDKNIIGGEAKQNSILYLLSKIEKASPAKMMLNITCVSSRYIGEVGFSIGLIDVQPGHKLQKEKKKIVERGYHKCKEIIYKLETDPQIDKDVCEMEISCTLNNIREDCGSLCIKELSKYNSPSIMQACGSKGSKINISQMIACVGQQIISGKRIPNGMLDRTLPHFDKFSITPQSKGFVENSFYTGMTPPEFFFHAISGREGLVDTAVKTAETGYMQRRLMKALEDLSVCYDYTVRSAFGEILQYKYGEDGIDPVFVEADDFVDLQKLLKTSAALITENEILNLMNVNKDNIVDLIYKGIQKLANSDFINRYCRNILNEEFFDKMVSAFLSQTRNTIFHKGSFIRQIDIPGFYTHFFDLLQKKILTSFVEPGTAVGAIAGQSIGEPGTQMTLKTFHFAGVSSMDITLGVPRLKEIINAVSNINTPIITVKLTKTDLLSAQIVKGKIAKILFKDICSGVTETISRESVFLDFLLDTSLINKLRLQIDPINIKSKLILTEQIAVVNESVIRVTFKNGMNQSTYNLQKIKKKVMDSHISGISTVTRALIHNDKGEHSVIIEGYGLRQILGLHGVDTINTIGNSILEVQDVLGIEAARALIVNEIEYVVGKHGIKIDPRHIMLLADCMTSRGEVLGITRFGISKMSGSTLMLASFEQTGDHLFDAALSNKSDEVCGVSESIILGKPIQLGTGSIELFWDENRIQ